MACPRCQTLPLTSSARGELLLTFAVRELRDKCLGYLEQALLVHRVEEMVVRLPDTCLLDFLERLRVDQPFNALEREGILALLLAPGEGLDFHAFTRAHSLERWFALLAARPLLEILEYQRFVSWFQPIVSIADGAVVGHEALLRGRLPEGGLMFPGEIFSLAAANDLLFQVDRQARAAALHCAAAQGLDGLLFINFLPTAIYDPVHCLRSTVGWARKLGIDPGRIVFEVVETERVGDIEHLKRILDYYRDAGYRVALDDVGSGYASLNLLAQLRPDIIKVDMEIIRDIDRDPARQSIYRALAGIAAELDIELLAEGIETEAELDYVRRHGADLVQGYLFGRPGPGVAGG
ncbi:MULTISPECIES: EAL domain-containing protein [Marichromatium]|uniref:EAL domain-containing protein (Putative c-di-GMP-specific phosphodiesterase class I) n=1 Tax=Marichromatium gracile TaxID=1048 RepID=A0A4V2W954_MARGR|nr:MULTISPECIES: EAL domain-containing protein [Marichromatium]MBO8084826.1 EAL domain-containing protein [Marichromatium sp.]MBK1709612.1 diguanylate phosphodiesterase [Marichromatium gracile]RNE90958.1 EAL domain-containing protein [Marichromatium sp. AB31]RNE93383.1 EAL domain-containing protein [Marichromatium sp. AB32]TCW34020.1 EAL domain-containing protein (putative c-di-GMP-specific phosphodiesterase class I) [Marichromatium gracile]